MPLTPQHPVLNLLELQKLATTEDASGSVSLYTLQSVLTESLAVGSYHLFLAIKQAERQIPTLFWDH